MTRRLADEVLDLAQRAGFPRVRVRMGNTGIASTTVGGAKAWHDVVAALRHLEHGPERNQCQIVYVNTRAQLPDRSRLAAAGERPLSEYPSAAPSPAARRIVDEAYADAAAVLDLPGAIRFEFVRRPPDDQNNRLGSARRLTDADGDGPGVLVTVVVNQPVAGLRWLVLHEIKHASDLLTGRDLALSVDECERRANAFADRMVDLRLLTRLRGHG